MPSSTSWAAASAASFFSWSAPWAIRVPSPVVGSVRHQADDYPSSSTSTSHSPTFRQPTRCRKYPWVAVSFVHREVLPAKPLRCSCRLFVVRPESTGIGVRVTGCQVDQVGADAVLADVVRAELLDDRVVVGDAFVLEQRPSVGVGQEDPRAFRRVRVRTP